MARKYFTSLDEAIKNIFGPPLSLLSERGVSGGCINDTALLTLSNQSKVFIKRNKKEGRALFEREVEGLRGANIIVIPIYATYFGGKNSASIILPLLVAGDITAMFMYHQKISWSHFLRLLPA